MSAHIHNRILERAEERARALEPKLAKLLEPILIQAGNEAARRFSQLATSHVTAAARPLTTSEILTRSRMTDALAAAGDLGVTKQSTMMCLKPRIEQAARIADPDGLAPEILHVTLAYLGETDVPLADVADALRRVTALHAPLEGIVGGYGQFGMPDGGRVGILLPDVPGLVELRVALTEALHAAGIDYSRDHGFEAHITIDADPEDGEGEMMLDRAYGEPLSFADVWVVRGDVEMLPLPLHGSAPVTAAARSPRETPTWTSPAPDELVDIDKVVSQLRTKTDPVRQAVVKQAASASMGAVGIDYDATNPFVANALEKVGRNVSTIAETTRDNVRTIIGASYVNGLTIPDTAKAIREGMAAAAPARATLIARTELAGAVNGGSLAGIQAVSAASGDGYQKTWMTAPGAANPRHETYDDLDGQTVPLDATFTVGGAEMQYPGDPSGPAEEVCNCRCSMRYDGEEVSADEAGGGLGGLSGGNAAEALDQAAATGGFEDNVSVGEGPALTQQMIETVNAKGLTSWPPARTQFADRVLHGKPDTLAVYKSKSGTWAADRQSLHETIIAKHFEGKTAALKTGEKPHAFFSAGGSASGKSQATFKIGGKTLSIKDLEARDDVIVIDPDRIKAMLPEYTTLRDAGDFGAASAVHEESSEIAKAVQAEATRRGLNVVIDTTGSSDTFLSKMEVLRSQGYDVQVTMFSIPTNEAIGRSIARGDRSGRYVAITPLKAAHAGASKQLGVWSQSEQVNEWHLYDNTGKSPQLVAYGGAGKIVVVNQSKYAEILAKAKEATPWPTRT